MNLAERKEMLLNSSGLKNAHAIFSDFLKESSNVDSHTLEGMREAVEVTYPPLYFLFWLEHAICYGKLKTETDYYNLEQAYIHFINILVHTPPKAALESIEILHSLIRLAKEYGINDLSVLGVGKTIYEN